LTSYVQEHDELTEASNAVVDMVQAGNLDAAEQAAHDLLARQASAAQQKLKRSAYSWPSPGGQPRGLRSYDAECSAPPQSQHRAVRAEAARSRSKTSNCSWNLASASTA
jgi:hypothetical protein